MAPAERFENTAHELLIKAQTGNIARPDKRELKDANHCALGFAKRYAGKAYKPISTHDQTDLFERQNRMARWMDCTSFS